MIFDYNVLSIGTLIGWFMCQKDGRTGWVPGSYLMERSSMQSFDQSEVLGFVGSMELSYPGVQNSKFMRRPL